MALNEDGRDNINMIELHSVDSIHVRAVSNEDGDNINMSYKSCQVIIDSIQIHAVIDYHNRHKKKEEVEPFMNCTKDQPDQL